MSPSKQSITPLEVSSKRTDIEPPVTAEFLNMVFVQKLAVRENVDNSHEQFKPVCKMIRFLPLSLSLFIRYGVQVFVFIGKAHFLNIFI